MTDGEAERQLAIGIETFFAKRRGCAGNLLGVGRHCREHNDGRGNGNDDVHRVCRRSNMVANARNMRISLQMRVALAWGTRE
jgi:hypothetical protein